MHQDTATAFPWMHLATLLAVFVVFVAVVAVVARGRRQRLMQDQGRPPGPLEGFAGWLALLVLGQTLAPFRLAADLARTVAEYGPVLTLRNGTALAYAETAANALLVLFAGFVALRMWGRRRTFPVLFTWQWALLAALPVIDAVAVSVLFDLPFAAMLDRDFAFGLARSLVGAAWVLYVHRSVRVRNTFVR